MTADSADDEDGNEVRAKYEEVVGIEEEEEEEVEEEEEEEEFDWGGL